MMKRGSTTKKKLFDSNWGAFVHPNYCYCVYTCVCTVRCVCVCVCVCVYVYTNKYRSVCSHQICPLLLLSVALIVILLIALKHEVNHIHVHPPHGQSSHLCTFLKISCWVITSKKNVRYHESRYLLYLVHVHINYEQLRV